MKPPFPQLVGLHDVAQLPHIALPREPSAPQNEWYFRLAIDQCHLEIGPDRHRDGKFLAHQIFDMMDVGQHLERPADAEDECFVRRHQIERRAPTAGTLGRLVTGGQRLRQRPERRDPIDRMAALSNTLGAPKYLRRQPHLRGCAMKIETRVTIEGGPHPT